MLRSRRRDRRGRGLRGPLSPVEVPIARTRAERFDDLVLDAVERLEQRWAEELRSVEFAVEDVPSADPERGDEPVPLARVLPAHGELPQRIVVYRWPIESRAPDRGELAALVHDLVVEQVAELLGIDPQEVDPRYRDPDEE
jgi:predicted Zn-dependent protease with MMP-like domain